MALVIYEVMLFLTWGCEMVDILNNGLDENQSIFDRESWESFILPIMGLSDSQHCHIVLLDKEFNLVDGIATSTIFSESDALHAHNDYLNYAHEDQRLIYYPTVVSGNAVNHQSLFLDKKMEKTTIYNELLIKYHCDNQAFIRAGNINGHELIVSIMREKNQGVYSNEELKSINSFIPSITNNVQIGAELNRHKLLNASYLDFLNQQGMGVVFLSDKREIVETNNVAQNILSAQDGIFDSNNVFRVLSKKGNQKLSLLFNSVTNNELSNPIFIKRSKQIGFHKLSVKKLNKGSVAFHKSNAQFMVLISEVQSQISFQTEEFKEHFRLTKAESDLVTEVANGLTLNEYSELKHISKNTARWTLANVFSKTNTQSQLELQRLLMAFSS